MPCHPSSYLSPAGHILQHRHQNALPPTGLAGCVHHLPGARPSRAGASPRHPRRYRSPHVDSRRPPQPSALCVPHRHCSRARLRHRTPRLYVHPSRRPIISPGRIRQCTLPVCGFQPPCLSCLLPRARPRFRRPLRSAALAPTSVSPSALTIPTSRMLPVGLQGYNMRLHNVSRLGLSPPLQPRSAPIHRCSSDNHGLWRLLT